MRKIVVILLILITGLHVNAQQLRQVQLVSSQKLKGFGGEGLLRVIKPVFSHEGSTLSSDSANFNQDQNTFQAFGNVVITQSDGTLVYSDLLNYNGNTRIAILTNNVRLVDKDAILSTNHLTYNMASRIGTYTGGGKIVNGETEVVSKNGFYFAATRDAYFRYDVNVNTPQVLIKSDTLRYNSGTKIAYFYGPTNISGKKDKSNLYTENGEYNTLTDQAKFGKRNLYTEGSRSLKGDSLFYDKKAGYGRAVQNITFLDTAQQILLKGNLGIYREADSSTLVTRNAHIVLVTQDSANVDSIWMAADTLFTKLILKKDLKPIQKEELKSDEELDDPGADSVSADQPLTSTEEDEGERSTTTTTAITTDADATPEKEEKAEKDRPKKNTKKSKRQQRREKERMAKAEEEKSRPPAAAPKDTSLAARSTLADTTQLVAKKDSIVPAAPDTSKTRIVMAYHNVKIFKSDLQSVADSAFYSYADSTIRCYVNPMIWTQGSQLSADTIYMQLKNNKLDNMLLHHNGFIVSTENDSTKFNQIKGKMLTGFFRDNKLDQIYVDGNAESIYYTVEDSAYTGMNRSVSSRMRVTFSSNELQDVFFIRKPELTYYPIETVPKEVEILEGFIWKPKERPKSKEEIIPTTTLAGKTEGRKQKDEIRKPKAESGKAKKGRR